MILDAVVERFVEKAPIAAMARVALQSALEPQWIDALFERHRKTQYQGELLFSTTVELMAIVASGHRPSLHAAIRTAANLPVSLQAVYDKIRHTEPEIVRALVQGCGARLSEVMAAIRQAPPPTLKGYRVRIVDGNHLPASERRLKPLRTLHSAPLPGQSLVIYDPTTNLVLDMVPGEDAHANERTLMQAILPYAHAGELWIADRNFSTSAILTGWQERGCCFIVREHGRTPNPREAGPWQSCGSVETGAVREQAVALGKDDGRDLTWRRIEVQLNDPTTDGDTAIRLLTNLPASEFNAQEVATQYRRRWRIESMFGRLEAVLHSEVTTLAHPRAALFAFGVATMAWNVLAVLEESVKAAHDLDAAELELSSYFIAIEIRALYEGMMMATTLEAWRVWEQLPPAELGQALREMAAHVDPYRIRKSPRGPKKAKPKSSNPAAEARHHVSTYRILKQTARS